MVYLYIVKRGAHPTDRIQVSNINKLPSSSGLRDANIVSRLLVLPMRSSFRGLLLGGRKIHKLVHADRLPLSATGATFSLPFTTTCTSPGAGEPWSRVRGSDSFIHTTYEGWPGAQVVAFL